MALAFKSIGTAFTTTSSTTFTANVPTSTPPASGDLLIAVGVDWAGSGVTWTTPTGWTAVRNDNDGGTGDIGVHVYRKIAGASEANQNFTLSVAESGVMVMLCYSGQDATNPIDVSGASMTDPSAASATLTTPVVTTTVAGDILLLIYGHGSDINNSGTQPTLPLPSSTTQRLATTGVNTGGGVWNQLMLCDVVQAASGASAQFSSASTGNSTSTYGAAAITVAIKAPAGGGSTPISASDSATLTDTVTQIGVNGPTDTGALGESSAIGAGLGTSDTASVAEQQAIALLNTDTAAFVEQIVIAVTKSDSDSGQVGEQASIGASTSTQDTGQVGDQATVSAAASAQDTAALAEQIKIALTAVDSAQLGEAMAIALATSDTAHLQELVSVALAIADAASLSTETLTVQQLGGNTPSSSDSATLTDAQLAVAARVSASDVGTLAEQAAIALKATDVAAMTEQIGLGLIAADSAALIEQLRVAITASTSDSTALADVQLAVNAALAASDAATLGESVTVQVFSGGLRDWVYAISEPTLAWSASEPSARWTTAELSLRWSVSAPIQ